MIALPSALIGEADAVSSDMAEGLDKELSFIPVRIVREPLLTLFLCRWVEIDRLLALFLCRWRWSLLPEFEPLQRQPLLCL